MANKNKNKGTYHEKWFVNWLTKAGVKEVERQPLSGSLGGKYRGDITMEMLGQKIIGEVKYRDLSNFPNAFSVLEERDIAFYKRKKGSPQVAVIIPGDLFIAILEKINDHTKEIPVPQERESN